MARASLAPAPFSCRGARRSGGDRHHVIRTPRRFSRDAVLAGLGRPRRRRHVDLRRLSRGEDEGRLWLGAGPGVARQGPLGGGAADRRLLGQLRLGRGPDPHQPPLRRGLPAEPVDREGRLPQEGLHRRRARPTRSCARASRPKSSPRSATSPATSKARSAARPGLPRSRPRPPPSPGSKARAAPTPRPRAARW